MPSDICPIHDLTHPPFMFEESLRRPSLVGAQVQWARARPLDREWLNFVVVHLFQRSIGGVLAIRLVRMVISTDPDTSAVVTPQRLARNPLLNLALSCPPSGRSVL